MAVFPGIEVLRIDTKESAAVPSSSPPIGIDEAPDIITPKIIEDSLETDHEKLHYSLRVGASNKYSAKVKARAFVRAKNPFEPSLVEITSIAKERDHGLVNKYAVGVSVSKAGVEFGDW